MGHKSKEIRDVKMQKRSHHVVENKGSGSGSFAKTNPFKGRTQPVLGYRGQVAGCRGQVTGNGEPVAFSVFGFRFSNLVFQVSNFEFRISSFGSGMRTCALDDRSSGDQLAALRASERGSPASLSVLKKASTSLASRCRRKRCLFVRSPKRNSTLPGSCG
jgi:hypothetical protein